MNHRRLVFPRTGSPVPNDYANLYRWGDPTEPAPLLVYVGGQIGLKRHAERFETEPTPVVDELLKAFGGEPPARLDFLVLPAPPLPRTAGSSPNEDFEDFFEHELLPAIDAPAPSAIGFVGYSYGAFLATYVALGLEETRALVTLGGVGISRAIQLARPGMPSEGPTSGSTTCGGASSRTPAGGVSGVRGHEDVGSPHLQRVRPLQRHPG
jgi:hypothetical protein